MIKNSILPILFKRSAVVLMVVFLAGCDYSFKEDFLDGKIQYEPKTAIGRSLKASYEACSDCAVDKVQRLVVMVRYLKPALCGAGVVPACVPDIKAVDQAFAAMKARLAGDGVGEIIVDALQKDFSELPEAERRAVLTAALNVAGS